MSRIHQSPPFSVHKDSHIWMQMYMISTVRMCNFLYNLIESCWKHISISKLSFKITLKCMIVFSCTKFYLRYEIKLPKRGKKQTMNREGLHATCIILVLLTLAFIWNIAMHCFLGFIILFQNKNDTKLIHFLFGLPSI